MVRFDIRRAAREQQPIACLQAARARSISGPSAGTSTGTRVRALRDGFDVLLADHVEIVLSTQPAIGRNSDERQARHV